MTPTADILRGLPYFADLPTDLLDKVCQESEQIDVSAGSVIIEEGTLSEEMYVVVAGEFAVTKAGSASDVQLAILSAGDVVGEIALLDSAPRTATVTATMDSQVVRVPSEAFEDLISDARVVRRMFKTVTARLRGIEVNLRHDERMTALGKMAAQLMHELNNPAAAVGRSSAKATEVYAALGDVGLELSSLRIDVQSRIPELVAPDLNPLERSEKEDALADLLGPYDIPEVWEIAPALVAEGWDEALMASAIEGLEPDEATAFARWLGLRSLANQILGELNIAANRVSDLVRVVKGYSFLDQAPVQEIDVTDGLSDTLILLKPKLADVDVVTRFEDGLATVEAPGRDLNQVWTNLIDNAADAMDGEGELTITTQSDATAVTVEIADTGPGMDSETAERIFDPFFTTKEPGKGTGLGLHTVHTIMQRCGGDISVTSSSQGTTFTVTIPVAEQK
ncbi:MAG: ATP-binding protein [Acidimicrobiia bacterium]